MAISKLTQYKVNKFLGNTPATSAKPVTPSNGATTNYFSAILIPGFLLLSILF